MRCNESFRVLVLVNGWFARVSLTGVDACGATYTPLGDSLLGSRSIGPRVHRHRECGEGERVYQQRLLRCIGL